MMRAENIRKLLKTRCGFDVLSVRKIKGGWSAAAFVAETSVCRLLVKEYRKSRAVFQKLIAPVDFYMPVLKQLNTDPLLAGKISRPVKIADGRFWLETDDAVYILFEYAAGRRAGQRDFNVKRVSGLADVIARLHDYSVTDFWQAKAPSENFETDFCSSLLDLLRGRSVSDLWTFISPYMPQIEKTIDFLERQAEQLRKSGCEKVLCHTDIHAGNLITTKDDFVVIDWEGLKFAPPEADLFCVYSQPWKDVFFKQYLMLRQNAHVNQACLLFYQKRRILEDIWEFSEQLQFEKMSMAKRAEIFCFLKILCEQL